MQRESPHFYVRARLPKTPEGGYLPYPKRGGSRFPGPTCIPAKLLIKRLFAGAWEIWTEGIIDRQYPADEIDVWIWVKDEQKTELDRIEFGMEVEIRVETGVFSGTVSKPPLSDVLLSEILAKRPEMIPGPHLHVRARPVERTDGDSVPINDKKEIPCFVGSRMPAKIFPGRGDPLDIAIEIGHNDDLMADEVEIRIWLFEEHIRNPPRIRVGMEVSIRTGERSFEGFVFDPERLSKKG